MCSFGLFVFFIFLVRVSPFYSYNLYLSVYFLDITEEATKYQQIVVNYVNVWRATFLSQTFCPQSLSSTLLTFVRPFPTWYIAVKTAPYTQVICSSVNCVTGLGYPMFSRNHMYLNTAASVMRGEISNSLFTGMNGH